ncbi:MAG: hypothetical protein IPJ20_00920 [Flammeovirgaceae bacterium]|nr:hypothetical protein [Flammeovirgaceae bacterium]MBP9926041.1 hypothetical protein [Cyclobacteriaceae bacterium]
MKNAIELNDYGLRELDSREVNEIQGGAYWWLLEAAAIAEAVTEFGKGFYAGFTRTIDEIKK